MPDLRSALTEALDKIEPVEAVEAVPVVEAPAVAEVAETAEAKADRLRDEAGRFAKGEKPTVAPPPPVVAQAVETPAIPAIQRPSTWKKDYWPLWDKLSTGQTLSVDEARKLAEYTNQRENEFKSGVSTYKAEAEGAREIQTAMAPFMADLQRYQINPGQWIANLGNAHRTLALGSPQERLQMFKRMAQEYQIPVHMLAEGAQAPAVDPQVNWMTQELNNLKQQQQQWLTVQQQREQQDTLAQIIAVRDEKGSNGQPLRPHFDEVKAQMSGLLQAGIAQDLKDAYEKAVRMNDQLWQQHQAAQTAAAAAQRAASAQAVVAKAKASAVSPKSASPSASGAPAAKGLRASLEESFSALEPGGRV